MKITIISLISLLAGIGVGSCIGYRHYEKYATNVAIQQMVQGTESSDALAAATSIEAIGLIESGDTQKAVRFLSGPIAHYYYLYAINAGTNKERRLEMRALTEQLIDTDTIVADEITNEAVNYQLSGKVQ